MRLRRFVRRHPRACFFIVAYALAWTDWVPMAMGGRHVGMDPRGPTHFLGLLAPMVAAFAVTTPELALGSGRNSYAARTRARRLRAEPSFSTSKKGRPGDCNSAVVTREQSSSWGSEK